MHTLDVLVGPLDHFPRAKWPRFHVRFVLSNQLVSCAALLCLDRGELTSPTLSSIYIFAARGEAEGVRMN